LTDALSATLGEICACVARVPTEIVKQRAQTTPNHRLVHIVSELYAGGGGEGKAGVRGFYKGFYPTFF
jgi:solute carrier family 25 (mitochondrial S-adenosylmethionine transporter), member 26